MHTANKQRITGEDCSVVAILEEVANAVLSVARCVQSLDLDAFTYSKCFAMARRLVDFGAILATDNGDRIGLELETVLAMTCMVNWTYAPFLHYLRHDRGGCTA